jgi:hypothetical protein
VRRNNAACPPSFSASLGNTPSYTHFSPPEPKEKTRRKIADKPRNPLNFAPENSQTQQRQRDPHRELPLLPRSQHFSPAFHQTDCKQVRPAQAKAKGGLKPIPARTHSLTGVAEVLAPPAKEGTRNALSTRGGGEQRQRLLARRRGRAYLRARTGASSWASALAFSRPGAWFEPSRWAPRSALAADGFDSELSRGRAGRRWGRGTKWRNESRGVFVLAPRSHKYLRFAVTANRCPRASGPSG